MRRMDDETNGPGGEHVDCPIDLYLDIAVLWDRIAVVSGQVETLHH